MLLNGRGSGRWRRGGVGLLLLLTGCERAERPSGSGAPPAEVVVSQPLAREVTDSIELTGTIAAIEAVEIRARVTGFLEQVHYQPRERVEKGATLFTIDPRPFRTALERAQADLAAVEARLIKAESDLDKVEGLVSRGAASEDERTTALAIRNELNAEGARARASIAQAQLDLGFCTVTSPINGKVSRNLIDVGNIVIADSTVLATVVNDDDVHIYFNAGEGDVLKLRDRRMAQLLAEGKDPRLAPPEYTATMAGLMNEDGYPHEGMIDYVAPNLDPSTGTIQVRARFSNRQGRLIPGLFARVRVPISKPYTALTVTERALGSDQGQRYVLVVNAQNVVEYRPVQVGSLQGGLRVIDHGLPAGEWVITNGLQRVRPGLTVKPIQAPMPVGPAVAPSPTQPAANQTASAPSARPH